MQPELRVLVVEDDAIRALVAETLREAGYEAGREHQERDGGGSA